MSHLLEHMAFKGTSAAQRPRHRRGDRGGGRRPQRRDLGARPPPISPTCWARTSGSASTSWPTSSPTRCSRPTSSKREKSVILQEIGAANDTPGRHRLRPRPGGGLPGPGDRPLDPRHAGVGARGSAATSSSAYLAAITAPARPCWRRSARSTTTSIVAAARARLPALRPGPAARAAAGGVDGRRRIIDARDLDQAHLILGFEGVSYHDPAYYALQAFTIVVGGGMSSRLFQEVREKRGPGLFDLQLPLALRRHRPVRRLCRHRRGRHRRGDAR